jgi:AhpD family alkylhydroperoxidase
MDRVNAPASSAPTLLAQLWRAARRLPEAGAIWGARRLDPKLREEVMLAVARANACRLCTTAHRRWAVAEGVSDAEIAALEIQNAAQFDRRTWAAIAWADARARADLGPAPTEFEEELARYYTPAERDDLELVTIVMTFGQLRRGARCAAAPRSVEVGAGEPSNLERDRRRPPTLSPSAVGPAADRATRQGRDARTSASRAMRVAPAVSTGR